MAFAELCNCHSRAFTSSRTSNAISVAVAVYSYGNMINGDSGAAVEYLPNFTAFGPGPLLPSGSTAVGRLALCRRATLPRSRSIWTTGLAVGDGTRNGSGTANPATNIGGLTIRSMISYAPAIVFTSASGQNFTANFGATAAVSAKGCLLERTRNSTDSMAHGQITFLASPLATFNFHALRRD